MDNLNAFMSEHQFATDHAVRLREFFRQTQGSWLKMASTLSDDTAPSASLDRLKARAAPTHPGAQPEPLGSLPWPQELASGRPKVE